MLVGIESDGAGTDEVLARAAGLERHSEHGLARAITMAAATRGLEPVVAGDVRIRARPRHPRECRWASRGGWERRFDERTGLVSLRRPWASVRGRWKPSGYSVIYVGWGERVRAVLSLDDTPLPEARSTIDALRSRGLHVTLLTGDLAHAAQRVAVAVGIVDVQAGLSPEAKRAALDQQRQRYGVVAMVGDGLNDGPVLADADVGIAVGSATDLARETAASGVARGMGCGCCHGSSTWPARFASTILTNLMWAFGYNLIALTLAVLGLLQPVLAAAVMAGSSILVVVNSLRLERLPDPVPSPLIRATVERRGGERLPPRWRSSDDCGPRSSGAERRLQPNTSWVNAAYQPSASRTAWRRVSAFSPTLLMKMSLILIVSGGRL